MGDYNVTVADFAGKNRICMTDTLYQYDYGQKLQIDNIPALPQTYEAHFSNVQHGGVSITVTGMDGIVDIPNSLLMTGKRIYCWIYVTEPGSGETEYQVLIPVQARPMPEYYDVTDVGVFDSVVQQVGDYAATATAGATNATASATAAAASASEAAASALAAETAKTAAETAQGKAEDAQTAAESAAQTATDKASQTAQDAAQAALDAGRAESAAQRAEAAEMGAESAKTDAETAAQGAAASASAASASATSAGQAATSAVQSATAAAQSAASIEGDVQTATQKAAEATSAANQAVAAKDAAVAAQQGAETSATSAGQSASTATAKAAEAATSASNAAASETEAEAAATRAGQAAASLVVDDALSDSSTNPVQNKVVTAEFADVKSALANAADYSEDNISTGTITANSWYQNNGTVISHADYSRTDKLSIKGVYALKVNFTTEKYRVHFFNANQARIALVFSMVANQYYAVPEGAEYIGISGATSDMNSLTITALKKGILYSQIVEDNVKVDQGIDSKGSQIIVDYSGRVVPHKYFSNAHQDVAPNLFDKNRLDIGSDVNGVAKSGYASMAYYLPVFPGVKYCVSTGVSIYQQYGYDEYHNVVTTSLGLSGTGQTLPNTVKYIRLCVIWNQNTYKFGIYAGLDSYNGVDLNYGDIPNYYSADDAFDRYLKRFGFLADKAPVLADDGGRYSGIEDIEQYSRLVHPTSASLAVHASDINSEWYARGVKQYFSATEITITNQTGIVGIYNDPSDIGAVAGDTVYLGFLARSADGNPHTVKLGVDSQPVWNVGSDMIYIDGDIRAYEFSHVVAEGEGIVKFRTGSIGVEFSNIYVRKASNLPYEHLFIDPQREEVKKYIISDQYASKTIVAFGDSVTAAGYYLNAFKKRIPVGTLINEGVGGSCFCYTDTSYSANFYNIVETKRSDIESADVVTVSYGTNDSNYLGKTTSIGSIAPVGSTFDLLTTYGAIQAGIEKIIGYNPVARIVLIIPATWINYDYRDLIAKAIKDCAELYGCLCVDFRSCGCNGLTQTGMTWDGLHPTSATGELCGKILVDAMRPVYML